MKDARARAVPVETLLDKLDGLRMALDTEQVRTVLGPMLARSLGAGVRVEAVGIEVLRSRTNRCLLRYAVTITGAPPARGATLGVIAKVVRPGVGAQVYRNMRDLWQHGFGREAADGIGMPEPLGFVAASNLLLQEEVPGVPFKALVDQPGHAGHFRQLARALAKLHACPIVPGTPFTVRDHLLRCHPKHEVLAEACPELAPAVADVVREAHRVEATLGAVPCTPIHGDFHLGQLHLENGRAWLMDFDAMAYGDPAADLGNVLVFLKARARKSPRVRDMIETFLEEYFARADPALARRIPLYESLTQLRRACKCLRLQEDGWRRNAGRLVEAAGTALAAMRGAPEAP